ncbi:MAG: hypothetical protein Q4F05_07815 [bacterium]|nr:hypothetical protein [bacterium]
MYEKSKCIMMLTMLLSVTTMTACSSDNKQTSANDAFAYTVSIDGEQIEVAEDDANVDALKTTADKFLTAMLTKNYKSPDLTTEYELYTKEKREENEASGAIDAALAAMQTYELMQEVNEIDINNIEFFNLYGEKAAKVVTTVYATITDATEAYYSAIGIGQNVKYKRNVEITYILEDGTWRVSAYTATAREVA